MIFTAGNNTLTPVCRAATAYMADRDGLVDLVPVSKAKRRSLDANAKYWTWCAQVEREHGMEPGECHRLNKWTFGLAILTRSHPEYRDKLLSMLRQLDYESRLAAMDLVTCTSEFSVGEMNEYMDATQRHWSAQGTYLE